MSTKISDQNVITNSEPGFEDVFGKFIADGTSNEADIPSHYPFNPERWRLYQGSVSESNRIFLMYNDDSRYAHQRYNDRGAYDVHKLTPNAGERLILQAPELFRYIVGYEAYVTQALSISQELNVGDRIRFGPFDGTDGYGTEINGELGSDVAQMFIMRDGVKVEKDEVAIEDITESFTRFGHRFAWYNVGRLLFEQSYSQNGHQIKDSQNGISTDAGRGPRQGNLPIRFEVQASSSTSNLTANFGSSAWQTLGNATPNVRPKWAHIDATINTTGTWVPFAAVRKKPELELINTNIESVQLGQFTGSGDAYVLGIAVSPNKTDASGFVTPLSHSRRNSSVEHTDNVTTFPDDTGSVVSSTSNPGGYQTAYDRRYDTGQGDNQRTSEMENADVKRDLLVKDEMVFLAYVENTGDIKLDYLTVQDW